MKYRKKPVVIDALQWTGTNHREMFDFLTDYQCVDQYMSEEGKNFYIDNYIIGVGNKTCEAFCKNEVDGCKNCYIQQVFKKLADYEDLEDQGLLVRLPCKVGDTMYDIVGKPLRIVEHKVDAFHIDKKGFHLQIINGVLEKKQEAKVYFSREEAKKKLEEMKKND